MSEEPQPVGYKRPPVSTRFAKGRSGNPKGRPPGRRRDVPHEAVLGQMVTIREDGIERRVTAAEAFILHVTKKGLEGDSAAARAALAAIEEARARRKAHVGDEQLTIIIQCVAPGRVNSAMRNLGMARKLDPYRDTARMVIEPWLVQRALDRLGDRRLTRDEQEAVIKVIRTPKKVSWPDWWEVLP